MSYYIDDTYISNRFFEGETVPDSDKTITTSRNTSLKSRATKTINRAIPTTTNLTDTYGDLEEIAGDLYEMGLNNKPMKLTDDHVWTLQNRGYLAIPFAIGDPDDFELNENG